MAWSEVRKLELETRSPQDHLIWDEYLLRACDAGKVGPSLRIWTVDEPVVVMGYSNQIQREVCLESCRGLDIQVLRRTSGGGTVYLDKGCLNYSLVLPAAYHSALISVGKTNLFVMRRHQEVLTRLTGLNVALKGDTDLAMGDRKISGNAQRRARSSILFHGSFLCNADIKLMNQLLSFPSRQPLYRNGRSHSEFVMNLEMDATIIQNALLLHWKAISQQAIEVHIDINLWNQCRDRISLGDMRKQH